MSNKFYNYFFVICTVADRDNLGLKRAITVSAAVSDEASVSAQTSAWASVSALA